MPTKSNQPRVVKRVPIYTKNSASSVVHTSRRAAKAASFAAMDIARKRRGLLRQFHIVRRRPPVITEVQYNQLPKKNVLVLAPHPEEPHEKCFATIKGFMIAGGNVQIHTLTTGWHGVELSPEKLDALKKTNLPHAAQRFAQVKTRLREIRNADKQFGAGVKNEIHNMDFYNTNEVSKRDVALMKKIVNSGKWDVVIMPDPLDIQPTHAAVYDLAIGFLRRKVRFSRHPIELWGFETTYHRHPLTELNQIVYYTGEVQKEKMAAVSAHKSQEDRRGAVILGRMAEAERSSAIAEEVKGFGVHVDFTQAQRLEAFSKTTLKPYGPFVFGTKKRK